MVLQSDLDFHGKNSTYATHALHAFPAKFPPQLPQVFIQNLTKPGEIVLDPMMGSGTTLLEAVLLGRKTIGFDIDPLALRISQVKVDPPDIGRIGELGEAILTSAREHFSQNPGELIDRLDQRFDSSSRAFINYWFTPATQQELIALLLEIEKIEEIRLRSLFELILSATIITKSGGVSLARDLAHTRPHRQSDKSPRSALLEFSKRFNQFKRSILDHPPFPEHLIAQGNAQSIPLQTNSVDLIITSPPYANNAIDYMRANKFSLVWFGHAIDELSRLRSQYIGSDSITQFPFLSMPPKTENVLSRLRDQDDRRAKAVHRYYSEMKNAISEMYRVLKPGKAAVVVVGTSIIKGIDTQTHHCLAEIGVESGFMVAGIAERHLDRDKRMMPARLNQQSKTQIEKRMHSEYVIGFFKPGR